VPNGQDSRSESLSTYESVALDPIDGIMGVGIRFVEKIALAVPSKLRDGCRAMSNPTYIWIEIDLSDLWDGDTAGRSTLSNATNASGSGASVVQRRPR
jgi:hypothetical protein